MNYKKKYLKYKLKYLNLKKIYRGGAGNDDDDSDSNLEEDLSSILEQVLKSIEKGDDPIKANVLHKKENSNEKQWEYNTEILYPDDFLYEDDFEDYTIEDDVEENSQNIARNKDNIALNKNNIDINKKHIGQLFHICNVQQKQLQKISKTLYEVFFIQKKKLLNEWKDDYKKKLSEKLSKKKM
tara:strand:+ start:2239 stop:2787 length:549 start_codon:yes stop_codon:yes gene_type:complete